MSKKKLVFPDTDDGAELFGYVFAAFSRSPYETADDEELRLGMKIRDKRDAIGEEVGERGRFRTLRRGSGAGILLLTNAEYELFRRSVKMVRWPLADANVGIMVREFIENADTIEDDDDT